MDEYYAAQPTTGYDYSLGDTQAKPPPQSICSYVLFTSSSIVQESEGAYAAPSYFDVGGVQVESGDYNKVCFKALELEEGLQQMDFEGFEEDMEEECTWAVAAVFESGSAAAVGLEC
eukprot:tig00000704_g3294.t1